MYNKTSCYGFKKNPSTASVGFLLQSMIAGELDEDKNVLAASLNLSAAFNTVNIKLLIKRLSIIFKSKSMYKH